MTEHEVRNVQLRAALLAMRCMRFAVVFHMLAQVFNLYLTFKGRRVCR